MAKIDNVIDRMLAGDVQKQLEKNSSKSAVIASTAIISLALVAMRTIPEIINYLETCNTNGRADMQEERDYDREQKELKRQHELKIKEMELERLSAEAKMQYSDKLKKMEEQIAKEKAEAEKWKYYYQEATLDLEKLRKGSRNGNSK